MYHITLDIVEKYDSCSIPTFLKKLLIFHNYFYSFNFHQFVEKLNIDLLIMLASLLFLNVFIKQLFL